MNNLILGVGVVFLLVVVAAVAEAYFRSQQHRPLTQSRPKAGAKRAPGQEATDTTLLQDVLEERQRRNSGADA